MFIQGLSVNSYGENFIGTDANGLNLSWTIDERDFLDIDLMAYLINLIGDNITSAESFLLTYNVNDPFGSKSLCCSASKYFNYNFSSCQIYSGSGVSGLLFSLSTLPKKGIAFLKGAYMDMPSWVYDRKVAIHQVEYDDFFKRNDFDLIFLENPLLFNEYDINKDSVDNICSYLKAKNCYVVVDESYANYVLPEMSCIHLLAKYPNLIVLRGFSKAYGMGSLRLGVMFTSQYPDFSPTRIVPPLSATPLSILCGSSIWSLGDICTKLRGKIKSRKLLIKSTLEKKNICTRDIDNEYVPYVFLEDEFSIEKLEHFNIYGKKHFFMNLNGVNQIYRLSLPLRADRVEKFSFLLKK